MYPGGETDLDTTHAVSDFAGVGVKAVEVGFGGKVDGEAVEAAEAGFDGNVDVGVDVRDVGVVAERMKKISIIIQFITNIKIVILLSSYLY